MHLAERLGGSEFHGLWEFNSILARLTRELLMSVRVNYKKLGLGCLEPEPKYWDLCQKC